jgi:hypothetical protein
MTKTHEFHDLADIFPLLAGDEAKALARDIREHGLHESITLLERDVFTRKHILSF